MNDFSTCSIGTCLSDKLCHQGVGGEGCKGERGVCAVMLEGAKERRTLQKTGQHEPLRESGNFLSSCTCDAFYHSKFNFVCFSHP